jgi:drug/metabolite transporter (DMT)-like permease
LALGTLSGLAYGGLIVAARALSLRVAALPLLFTQNLLIAVVLAPGLIALGPSVSAPTWGLLVLVAAVHATGAGLFYVAGIRRVSAQAAAILGYLEPLLAAGWGAAFLGESLGPASLAGGVLILSSGALVVWAEGRVPKPVDAPPGGR